MPETITAPVASAERRAGDDRPRRRFTVDALFADTRPRAVGVSDLADAKEIRLDRIEPDPDQPRRTFDPSRLAELAESIRREGVLQPIAVRYDAGRDRYVVLHGERRWRAAREAGLAAIPAIVREVPAERRLIQQLMENIVRDDLNAVDRAAALRALKAQLGDAPWETVAEAVGIRRSRLFQLLGTEKLPPAAREDIRAGRLSEKESRALQGLAPGHQEALRAAIVEDDLPADAAMRLARRLRDSPIPDDTDTASAAIRSWRAEPDGEATSDADVVRRLLAAGRTGRAEPDASGRAGEAGEAPFDPARLRSEARALALTLARAPDAAFAPGSPTRRLLEAMRDALSARLDAATGDP